MKDASEDRTRSNAWVSDPDPGTPKLLVFWDGGYLVRSFPEGTSFVVGRSKDCDVRIDHPSVSRSHVRVVAGDRATIEDLGSANGSRLDGIPLPAHRAVPFAPGEVVEVGAAVMLLRPALGAAPSVPPAPITARVSMVDARMAAGPERLVPLVAQSNLSVVLYGETGAGKEVVAASIHRLSHRSSGPFVRLNCAALTETLLESELFGHEKGAFTGATQSKAGLLEAADHGTLFLDEVGEMPLSTQAKLLRALEAQEVLRVGSIKPRSIDVRFLAASNRDLPARIAEGAFRSDLYYRLNGITIRVPPLRERRREIERLAQTFAAEAYASMGRAALPLSSSVVRLLEHHSWPGNIRELKNVVARAIVLAEGLSVDSEHISFDPVPVTPGGPVPPTSPSSGESAPTSLREGVRDLERARIEAALDQTNGNQTRAAALLGLPRRTFVSRLDALRLPRPRKR